MARNLHPLFVLHKVELNNKIKYKNHLIFYPNINTMKNVIVKMKSLK